MLVDRKLSFFEGWADVQINSGVGFDRQKHDFLSGGRSCEPGGGE